MAIGPNGDTGLEVSVQGLAALATLQDQSLKKLVLNQGYIKGKDVHGEQRFAFDSSSYELGGRLEAHRKRLGSVGKAWVSLYAPMEFDGALAALYVSGKRISSVGRMIDAMAIHS